EGAANGHRVVVLHLFDVPGTSRHVAGGPVRRAGHAWARHRGSAAQDAGATLRGGGSGASGMVGARLEPVRHRLLQEPGGGDAGRMGAVSDQRWRAQGAGRAMTAKIAMIAAVAAN